MVKNDHFVGQKLTFKIDAQHPNMNFTSELEVDSSLAFLDVFVSRLTGKFVTSVYRKPTFSGVHTHYDSYIPQQCKSGFVYTLLHRSFSICTYWEQVHREIETIKSIMLKNGYPTIPIEKTVNYFLNKLFAKRTVQPTVQPTAQSNKNYQIIFPYLGIFTSRAEKKIKRALTEHLPGVKISFVYRALTRLRSLFSFKDRIPAYLRYYLQIHV